MSDLNYMINFDYSIGIGSLLSPLIYCSDLTPIDR